MKDKDIEPIKINDLVCGSLVMVNDTNTYLGKVISISYGDEDNIFTNKPLSCKIRSSYFPDQILTSSNISGVRLTDDIVTWYTNMELVDEGIYAFGNIAINHYNNSKVGDWWTVHYIKDLGQGYRNNNYELSDEITNIKYLHELQNIFNALKYEGFEFNEVEYMADNY